MNLIFLDKLNEFKNGPIKILFSLFIATFDSLIILLNKETSSKKYNLLIKVDAIGDFFIWLPFAKSFLKNNSNKPTILICNKIVQEVAEKLNLFDFIIPVDILKFKRNLIYRYKVIKKVNSLKAYITIHTTFSRNFLIGDSLVRCSDSNKKVGSKGDHINQNFVLKIFSDNWYTKLLSTQNSNSEITRNKEFFLNLYPGSNYDFEFIPKLINLKKDLKIPKPYIIIFPGASYYKRMWPVEKFAKLIKELLKRFSGEIVICGSKSEMNLCCKLESKIKNSRIRNLVGQTSLTEFTEIVRRSKLLISNETSAIHIAAALDVQSICILGGGHYGRFTPYPLDSYKKRPISVVNEMFCFQCNWNCYIKHSKNKPFPCIDLIEFKEVLKKANNYL